MSKQDTTGKNKATDQGKDEKKKKKFDNFGWYLAWAAFAAGMLGAFVTLARKSDTPKKNDYYI